MTTIKNDTLNHPYAAFDVSIYQPLEGNTTSLESLAIALARLTGNVLPWGLFAVSKTVGQLQNSEIEKTFQIQETKLLDSHRTSRVFLNALWQLHAYVSNPEFIKEANIINPFVFQQEGIEEFSKQDGNHCLSKQTCHEILLMQNVWEQLQAFCEILYNNAGGTIDGVTWASKDSSWSDGLTIIKNKLIDAKNPGNVGIFPIFEPFGLLHRYRQHFLYNELKAGPLEQVKALAPGESLEVVMNESYSRTYEETVENELEITQSVSQEQKQQNELSDRVAHTVANSATLAVSASGGYNAVLWSASGSVNNTVSSSSETSREEITKRLQETTRKQSEQIRKKTKVTTRVIETRSTDTTTRHVIQNKENHSVNYGLRRLCYDVVCKVQDLSPILVWQTFVEKPGETLARSELLDLKWFPAKAKVNKQTVLFRVSFGGLHPNVTGNVQTLDLSQEMETEFRKIVGEKPTNSEMEYFLKSATETLKIEAWEVKGHSNEGGHVDVTGDYFDEKNSKLRLNSSGLKEKIYELKFQHAAPSGFWLYGTLLFSMSLSDEVTEREAGPIKTFEPDGKSKLDEETFEVFRLKAIMDIQKKNGREGIVRPRDSLFYEERKILLAKVLVKMLGKTNISRYNDEALQQLYYKVNQLFDLKQFMYDIDVAEWSQAKNLAINDAKSRPAYPIHSEQEAPAPMGSSFNWEHQIDGDRQRDMFINADWAWVGIPIKPGKEKEAVEFMTAVGGMSPLDDTMNKLVNELEILRATEEYVKNQRFDEEKIGVTLDDNPVDCRPWLDNCVKGWSKTKDAKDAKIQDYLKNYTYTNKKGKDKEITWADVYPIISHQQTVTNVDGFIFDTISLKDNWQDNGSKSDEKKPPKGFFDWLRWH